MTMGDRICVMRDGVIMQVADPLTLYLRPDNLFVASFIGSPADEPAEGQGPTSATVPSSSLKTERKKDTLTFPLKGPLQTLASKYIDKQIVFGIRPENISNETEGGAPAHRSFMTV